MNNHYYTEHPNIPSRPKTWETELCGHSLTLTSDDGVFSKRGIDLGTKILMNVFKVPEVEGAILDMGCGYGPIGLACAKSNPLRKVVMVDKNERAVKLSAYNAEQNDIDNVQIFHGDLFQPVDKSVFAAIVTNPPIRAGKRVTYRLFNEAPHYLIPGGEFWTVVRKQQGAASTLNQLQTIFPEVTVVLKKKGYVVMKAIQKFDVAK